MRSPSRAPAAASAVPWSRPRGGAFTGRRGRSPGAVRLRPDDPTAAAGLIRRLPRTSSSTRAAGPTSTAAPGSPHGRCAQRDRGGRAGRACATAGADLCSSRRRGLRRPSDQRARLCRHRSAGAGQPVRRQQLAGRRQPRRPPASRRRGRRPGRGVVGCGAGPQLAIVRTAWPSGRPGTTSEQDPGRRRTGPRRPGALRVVATRSAPRPTRRISPRRSWSSWPPGLGRRPSRREPRHRLSAPGRGRPRRRRRRGGARGDPLASWSRPAPVPAWAVLERRPSRPASHSVRGRRRWRTTCRPPPPAWGGGPPMSPAPARGRRRSPACLGSLTRHADERGSFRELWRASGRPPSTLGTGDRRRLRPGQPLDVGPGSPPRLHLLRASWTMDRGDGRALVALVDVRPLLDGRAARPAVELRRRRSTRPSRSPPVSPTVHGRGVARASTS